VSFIEQTCVPYLKKGQNHDGGWGFMPNAGSRVEPTAWAILALQEMSGAPGVTGVERVIANAGEFLKKSQLADGSWPAALGQREGSWVTSLACWALHFSKQQQASVDRGVEWLLKEWPGEAKPLMKVLRLFGGAKQTDQDDSLSGWSWTPGTASWVEPTSYAMIVLRNSAQAASPKLQKRIEMAKAMLYDRMCPHGGWNCGNPMVYGVAGEPQVGPTVWALLALQTDLSKPKVYESMAWLEKNAQNLESPGSLALTSIALQRAGRAEAAGKLAPRIFSERNECVWNVQAAAWTTLAGSAEQRWLAVTVPGAAAR
jgi:hypothetical protein